MQHPAWKERGPEWAHLAPGVRFHLSPLTGELQARVTALTAELMAGLVTGRRDLSQLGFEGVELGALEDPKTIAGIATLAAGVEYCEALLLDWEGIVDEAGDKIEIGEGAELRHVAIVAALRHGPPEGGNALLEPLMAWIERPKGPIAAEQGRLRKLAKFSFTPAAADHCLGCALAEAGCSKGGDDDGDICPRVEHQPRTEPGIAAWNAAHKPGIIQRAGMEGAITGFDYTAALHLYAGQAAPDFVRCLQAIELGMLEGRAEGRKEP
jgi:hypothetical protein